MFSSFYLLYLIWSFAVKFNVVSFRSMSKYMNNANALRNWLNHLKTQEGFNEISEEINEESLEIKEESFDEMTDIKPEDLIDFVS